MAKFFNRYEVAKMVAMGVALFLTASCIDDDYDISNIDATVGVGSDTLQLPGNNNTQDITLDDVFDLSYTHFVAVDEDGYYYVRADDNYTHTMRTLISKIRATDNTVHTSEFTFTREDLSFGAPAKTRRVNREIAAHFTGTIGTFDLTMDNIPQSIVDLDYIATTANIRTTVSFSNNFKAGVNNIASVKLYLPKFLDVDKIIVDEEEIEVSDDNTAMLYNVSPKNNTSIRVVVKGLDFTKENDEGCLLEYVRGDYIHAKGEVIATGTVYQSDVDLSKLHASDVYTLTGKAVIGYVVVESAKGYFAPEVDFDRLGRVNIGNLPLFLDDENVVLDLDELKIDLDVNSELPIALLVKGALVGESEDKEIVRVSVPQFDIPENFKGVISFRNQNRNVAGDTLVVQVPQIAELLKRLPNIINFTDLEVVGNHEHLSEVELGHSYRADANFSLWAPLAFGEEARITYRHPYAHWNHVLKDVSFVTDEKGNPKGYCLATADIENKMPFFIIMSAYGLDVNGDSISTQRLSVEVLKQIPASADGKTPVYVQQQIVIKPLDNGVFKEMDGVMLKIIGTATDDKGENSVTGKRLNSKTHTLNLKNLKMSVVGQLAVDMN